MSPSKFCSSCGTAVAENAGFCASCGSAVGAAAPAATQAPAQPVYQQPYQQQAYSAPPKNKTTAVVLAVFLHWWSWLYTFKLNKAKFFIGLGVSVLVGIIQISTFVAASRTSSYYSACIDDYLYGSVTLDECVAYQPNYSGIYLASLLSFGIWLWCLIDNARKPQSYYQNFPNER
ncbi:MAG: zinc ribbon domain-containing protein [Rhodoluna sp.]|nr:zinc ribbon domain-containing protein [Rhodoluna sp.]